MTVQNSNPIHTPVLAHPLPLNWGKLSSLSAPIDLAGISELYQRIAPAAAPQTETPAAAPRQEGITMQNNGSPAPSFNTPNFGRTEPQRPSPSTSFPPGVPVFSGDGGFDELMREPQKPAAPAHPAAQAPREEPVFSNPQSAPASEPSPFGVSSFKTPSYVPPHQPDPVPVQPAAPQRDPSQELVSYLQPILERAISDRLSTVIDAAARSAADAAADRIRTEVLSKIDLIVRDAVEHETSRFLRMRR